MLVPGTGRFALGPLPEVAASTHAWSELRPYLSNSPDAGMAAHERVVRGEDLTGDDGVEPSVLELPLCLQPWEPDYPLATYRAHKIEVADAPGADLRPVDLPSGSAVRPADDPEAVRALAELAMAWKQESNGTVDVAGVDGGAASAVAALPGNAGGDAFRTGELRMAEVPTGHALAVMAEAAASGGAHGRRRGMAAGRFGAWWAVAALAGQLDEWPFDPDALGEAAGALSWYRWEIGAAATGWSLRLAVTDTTRDTSWAIDATDHT